MQPFTQKLVQDNLTYIERKRGEMIYTIQAPMVMSKIIKWAGRLDHFPKGIGRKIQFFMSELFHEDVLALYAVLLKGITEYNAHWQALMPIWGRMSIWQEKLDEHGWDLFEKAPTSLVTYQFDEYAAEFLRKQGFDLDEENALTIEHDWETFSFWVGGFNLMDNQSIFRIKPTSYTNNPWCPRSVISPDAQPKSKVRSCT